LNIISKNILRKHAQKSSRIFSRAPEV